MTRIRFLVMALLTAAAVGCGDKPTAPPNPPPSPPPPSPPPPAPPGSAIVGLTTPNSDDGAIAITLHGPGISNLVTASSGYLFYSRLASDTVARVIVVGNVSTGPLFTFKIASGSGVSAYTMNIDQVANRADAVHATLTGYSLTVTAAP